MLVCSLLWESEEEEEEEGGGGDEEDAREFLGNVLLCDLGMV